MQVVRTELKPTRPALIVVPGASLAYWKGELDYWLGDTAEVIHYTGPPGARQQIAQNELWLQPAALDGKLQSAAERLSARVPKPDVVLISMESMMQVRPACLCPLVILLHSMLTKHCTAIACVSAASAHTFALQHWQRVVEGQRWCGVHLGWLQ